MTGSPDDSRPASLRVDPPCLQIQAGHACQNDCLFCTDAPLRGVRGLTDEAVREILERNRGLPEVLFSRLEPTLGSGLLRWVGWARELGYPLVSIISNGRRLGRDDLAARLVDAGVNSFVISLHGHRAEVHDRLTRRPGSFAETVAGLDAIRRLQEQTPLTLRIVTTACALNVDHLPDIHAFGRGYEPEGQGWNALLLLGRALEHLDELAVAYPRIVDALVRCIEQFPDAPPGLMNVPVCLAHGKVPRRYLPRAEDVRMALVDAQGAVTEGAAGETIRPHLFHERCVDCALRPSCLGLSAAYVERFGWEGIEPVSAEALESDDDELGTPPPFVSEERLRRLTSPPDDQWELLELRTGPTDAFVRLTAHRPDRLEIALVLTPRDEQGQAFRRTRDFNVALRGQGYSEREEALAGAIVDWIRRQERAPEER
ncbi:MAG: radical SAM protein [bacterium]